MLITSIMRLELILTSSENNKAINGNPVPIEMFSQGNNCHSDILNSEYANTAAKAIV